MSENREFRIEDSTTVNASAERVWAAITDNTAGWMFPTDGWPAEYPVKEFPTHIISRMDGPDGWFNELEHQITENPDGTSFVRWVHSGVFAENWDTQFDAAAKHTAFYLHSLGEYLSHFDGRAVVFTDIQGGDGADAPDALAKVAHAMGESQDGTSVSFEVPGFGQVDAVVDYVDQNFIGLRTPTALIRVFGRNNFGSVVGVTVHDFAENAQDPGTTAAAWQSWLASAFA